jgi:hypothetical protein
MSKGLAFFVFFIILLAACKKEEPAPSSPAPTFDSRTADCGTYDFTLQTAVYPGPTIDTTYYSGQIYIDPNSTDSIVIRYAAPPVAEVKTVHMANNQIWFPGQTGPGALNSSGAIAFSLNVSTNVWHQVTGQRQ